MKRLFLLTTTLFLTMGIVAPLKAQTMAAQSGNGVPMLRNSEDQITKEATEVSTDSASRVLYEYIQAIASRNYWAAYNLYSPKYKARVSYEEFVRTHQNLLNTVSINGLELLPNVSSDTHKEFRVNLSATYYQAYPTGNGKFPEFFVLVPSGNNQEQWLIDGMAPGP